MASRLKILVLDPYHGGSHAQFVRTLVNGVDAEWTVLSLPGRHWKWRMRGAAPWFATHHADALRGHDVLLTTSMLALTDLVALAPHLAGIPRVLYFHENQLAYPVRPEYTGERDNHYGFTQVLSCLAATRCVFNSRHNRDTFLGAANTLLAKLPDAVDRGWIGSIEARSHVLGVPLTLPDVPEPSDDGPRSEGPIILWNHRWEHDKNPAAFLAALRAAAAAGAQFRLAVCGQRFRSAPPAFGALQETFPERIVHWGYAPDRDAYEAILRAAHIAVSTADHEFFGVSMLEATHFGARPLVPDRLSYPELFPAVYRYADDDSLAEQLTHLCRAWEAGRVSLREDRSAITEPHRGASLQRWSALLSEVVSAPLDTRSA